MFTWKMAVKMERDRIHKQEAVRVPNLHRGSCSHKPSYQSVHMLHPPNLSTEFDNNFFRVITLTENQMHGETYPLWPRLIKLSAKQVKHTCGGTDSTGVRGGVTVPGNEFPPFCYYIQQTSCRNLQQPLSLLPLPI